MSLASDISAPAALSPLLASGPAAAPVQVVNGAGFAEALTQAQTGPAAPAALSKLAALKSAAAKPAVALAEADVAEDMAVEFLPLPTVAGVGPAAVTQPVPDALPVAQTDCPSPVGVKAMPREAVAEQEIASSASPDAALPPFDAALMGPAPEPLAQPAGDLRIALSALRRLDDMDHGAEAAAQPVPDAPVTGIAPQDEAAAIADLAPERTDPAPDPLHAEIGGALSEAASSAPQSQPAAPVITPQLAPMA